MTRIHFLVAAAILSGLLLAGCAGPDHVLFMTKSNAGLDVDTKPPTLEVSVARKEVAVAPAFEGGATPPVMASFRSRTGTFKGFSNFFLGVGQTFAGGDAAVAMASLHDAPTVPATILDATPVPFDSAIETGSPADSTARSAPATGGFAQPFIFSTDTSFGLKVAWSGVGASYPDRVQLGFSRKEFAWAPVMARKVNGRDTVSIPSFLGTIETAQKLEGQDAEVGALQYFATGRAATLLALRREVRVAMLGRLDPRSQPKSRTALIGSLVGLQAVMEALQSSKDTVAIELLKRVRALDGLALPQQVVTEDQPRYEFPAAAGTPADLRRTTAEPRLPSATSRFQLGLSHLDTIKSSLHAIDAAQARLDRNQEVRWMEGDSAAAPITPEQKARLRADRAILQARLTELEDRLSSHSDVVASSAYLRTLLLTH